jgi:hypothetical protein
MLHYSDLNIDLERTQSEDDYQLRRVRSELSIVQQSYPIRDRFDQLLMKYMDATIDKMKKIDEKLTSIDIQLSFLNKKIKERDFGESI